MAKIGIVCDDYKVEMFKQELEAAGVIYDFAPFTVKGLTIFTCISEQCIIGPITDKVTQYWVDHFKQRKNN